MSGSSKEMRLVSPVELTIEATAEGEQRRCSVTLTIGDQTCRVRPCRLDRTVQLSGPKRR